MNRPYRVLIADDEKPVAASGETRQDVRSRSAFEDEVLNRGLSEPRVLKFRRDELGSRAIARGSERVRPEGIQRGAGLGDGHGVQ